MTELLVDRRGRVTVLTLNRPAKLNALSASLFADLSEAIRDFEADPQQQVAVITGAGKAFSVGADLGELADRSVGGGRLPIPAEPDIAGVAGCEKVTIAAVNGVAVSGGLELALCCDLRLAADDAWFGLFEVARGLVAGVAVSRLARLIPIGAALELMLTADRMPAADAHRLGLVQQVVESDGLLAAAVEKAERIAAHSPSAVRGTKQVVRFWQEALAAEQHRYFQSVANRVMLSGDFREGPRAFVEKRDPVFAPAWPSPDGAVSPVEPGTAE